MSVIICTNKSSQPALLLKNNNSCSLYDLLQTQLCRRTLINSPTPDENARLYQWLFRYKISSSLIALDTFGITQNIHKHNNLLGHEQRRAVDYSMKHCEKEVISHSKIMNLRKTSGMKLFSGI